ncbi:hypothetical protein [Clostridium akagii]|uniref:hypothetical protein n=1 Tax=Clostridium akagii TaxID=91623 RepID=UPI00047A2C43|nr:hypothetical protein [Clostridium akagii]
MNEIDIIILYIAALAIIIIMFRYSNDLRRKGIVKFINKELVKESNYDYDRLKIIIVATMNRISDNATNFRYEAEQTRYEGIYNTLQELLNKVEHNCIKRADLEMLLKTFKF